LLFSPFYIQTVRHPFSFAGLKQTPFRTACPHKKQDYKTVNRSCRACGLTQTGDNQMFQQIIVNPAEPRLFT
jgi:hypothetical protein